MHWKELMHRVDDSLSTGNEKFTVVNLEGSFGKDFVFLHFFIKFYFKS